MYHTILSRRVTNSLVLVLVTAIPLIIALAAFEALQWDFSVPMVYHKNDDVWQLILTKSLLDNGWFLNNPYLGAPGTATGYFNSAAQTSSIHSLIMKAIGLIVTDAVRVQYYYYFLNFSLISLAAYVSCRLLGVSRLFSASVGVLFSLSLYRLGMPYFAFISNYFMVPLGVVVAVWCAKGVYVDEGCTSIRAFLGGLKRSKKFWISVLIVLLMAISDGYYAFFTVLLLGLSSAFVFCKGQGRFLNGLVPLAFAGLIIGAALLVMTPLTQYRNANPEEFFPGGVQDPSLTIHPFEAEVYASSLKVMLTPSLNHRVAWVADIGAKMRQSGAEARKFGYSVTGQLGTLASFGFLLLMTLFLFPRWILDNRFVNPSSGVTHADDPGVVLYFLAVSGAFLFVCETVGGLGSLIAFIYPAIRAYERLSIFLIFVTLLALAFFLTHVLTERSKKHPAAWIIVAIVTAIFLFDQIPVNLARSTELPHVKRFVAEREFVRAVEKEMKPGDMIYQYPYAQYMAPSPHYGMGSQAQTRSYLHSKSLRWSNGASKNSRVDIWHRNLARLPAEDLLRELAIYGFKGALIDRWVVQDDEYLSVSAAAQSIGGLKALENTSAEMVFFKFPNYGFHLEMDHDFQRPERMIIHRDVPIDYAMIPTYIDGGALRKILDSAQGNVGTLDFGRYPEVLDLGTYLALRVGLDANLTSGELLGDVSCAEGGTLGASAADVEIGLALMNNSKVARRLNAGIRPITLGYHIVSTEGEVVGWDNGERIASSIVLVPGQQETVSFRIGDAVLREFGGKGNHIVFELLQEGNAWFGVNPENQVCRMQLPSAYGP